MDTERDNMADESGPFQQHRVHFHHPPRGLDKAHHGAHSRPVDLTFPLRARITQDTELAGWVGGS